MIELMIQRAKEFTKRVADPEQCKRIGEIIDFIGVKISDKYYKKMYNDLIKEYGSIELIPFDVFYKRLGITRWMDDIRPEEAYRY